MMAPQWNVILSGVVGGVRERLRLTVFEMTREEAKDSALEQAVPYFGPRVEVLSIVVEHIACNGAHPRPFAKSRRGHQRRAERSFVRGN